MDFIIGTVKSKFRKTFDLPASSPRTASPEEPMKNLVSKGDDELDQENQASPMVRAKRVRRATSTSLAEIQQNTTESPQEVRKKSSRIASVSKHSSAESTPSSTRQLRSQRSAVPSSGESSSVKTRTSSRAASVKKVERSESSLPPSATSSLSKPKRAIRQAAVASSSPTVSKRKSAPTSTKSSASKKAAVKSSVIKAEFASTKSGLYADISSSSGSEIDEGFDIDAALNPFDLSRTSSRKTGEWRRAQDEKEIQEKFEKEQHDPNAKSEWSATIEKHRNSTPLKQDLDDGSAIAVASDKMTGKDIFSLSPAAQNSVTNAAAVNQSGSPLSSYESKISPAGSPGAGDSPLRLRKSIQGINSLRKQLAERSLAKQMLSGESTPTSSKPSSTSSSTAKKAQQKDTPLRSLKLTDQQENNDTPRTRITRRTNALANEFNRLKDDASDGEPDAYVELQDVEIPVNVDKYLSDSEDSDEDKSKTTESSKKRALKKGVSFKSYFQDLYDSRRFKTSNNTLEQLVELDYDEYRNLLDTAVDLNAKKKSQLLALYRHDYDQWKFELSAGYNLLYYGFGSKRRLLNELVQSKINDGDILLIHGFFPSLNYREILTSILRELVQHEGAIGNATNQTNLIHDHYNSATCTEKLYLVIHNIDGPQLRSEKIQASLAKLAQSRNIRIIASTDHINAFSMWDARLSSQFNFLFHDLTTFESYNTETSDETYTAWMGRFLRGSGAAQIGGTSIRAALTVLNVVTKHSRDIFRLLAEHQMDSDGQQDQSNMDEGDDTGANHVKSKWGNIGMARNQLFQRARDKFIVSSDANFKVQMRELLDHRIVETFVLADATEVVYTPFNTDALNQILADLAQ